MKNLYRSRSGLVVHHSACVNAVRGGMPWRWAENQTRDYVVRVMRALGIRPCRVCKPLGPEPWDPNPRRES